MYIHIALNRKPFGNLRQNLDINEILFQVSGVSAH